ncbi:adenylyltransferase/cytidyltransferase family protein [Candidatus Shapirobacteria bacterium]|nr:adenylyltransferase/cytidyltransferase family protein [Candidatus Shapirobacteria bacterium]
MAQSYFHQIKSGVPLSGGLRKRCLLVEEGGEKKVFCLWPKGSLTKQRIKRTIKLELLARKKGLPCRLWEKIGDDFLKDFSFEGKDYWLGKGNYLPGKPAETWAPRYLTSAGKMLARLHRVFRISPKLTLLHLDFARANMLFDEKARVTGILDFEEAEEGEAEKDLACSLSFFVVDNPKVKEGEIWRSFLGGYQKGGGKYDYVKMRKYFSSFLAKRMEEKNPFLQKAKERLAEFRQRVEKKILKSEDLENSAKQNKSKKIVFNVGAYELLHYGHLEFLQKARSLGDLLIIGVASDESRRRLKGEPYPLISDRTRAETLAHFDFVDGVVIVTEDDVTAELKKLKPQIFYTTAKDWQDGTRKLEEKEMVEKYGGRVIQEKYFSPSISSSQMVEKVALLKMKQVLWSKVKRAPLLKIKKKKIVKEIKFADLDRLRTDCRQQSKTIVFTSLTADLFHLGHARFIQKAKSLGDVLVVGVPSNESVTALKGIGRPIVDERARALVLSLLPWVDKVVIFDERTVLGSLQKLRPDVFFTINDDWNTGFISSPEARFMKEIGGKIVRSEMQAPYLSASKMIDKAAGELIQKKFASLINAARTTPVLDADGFDPYTAQTQLAAREKGFYDKVLAEVEKRGRCVFCDLKEKYLIAEKNGVVLTVALFPYIDGHLLIIPRRHVERLGELNEKEQETIFYLEKYGAKILKERLGVENIWILLREGEGIKAGKTVNHFHVHLIPYDQEVIKMGEKRLTMEPIVMAKKLRESLS